MDIIDTLYNESNMQTNTMITRINTDTKIL